MIKIYAQQECNYRQVMDIMRMLPAACREVDAQAAPDTMRALNAITQAVTGALPHLYISVAEQDGQTIGFLGGILQSFVFETRQYAQDILAYIVPEHRGSTAYPDLAKRFAEWAWSKGALEVRGYLMNLENAEKIASAAKHFGYEPAGKIISLKRPVPDNLPKK